MNQNKPFQNSSFQKAAEFSGVAETGAPKSQAVLEQFCSPQFCSSNVLRLLRPSSQSVPDSVQSAVWHTQVWDRLHRRLSCSLLFDEMVCPPPIRSARGE